MPRIVIAFLAIGILATVAVAGFQASLETAGKDITIQNESWTPDAGNITTLNDSNQRGAYYSENVSVYDENDTQMEPGSDYTWFAGNGTIKALTGGRLDNDSTALITYSYQQTTREQRRFAGMLAELPRMLGLALPVGALLFLLAIARGGL